MELFDNGAERAILAGIMQYGIEAYVEICDVIDENSFGTYNNQVLFKCFKHIIENDQTIDLPCLLAASEKLNFSEIIQTEQELNYIKTLKDFYINRENIFSFAIQIKKFEYARNIIETTNRIKNQVSNITGNESIDDIINMIEKPVTEFIKEDSSVEKPEKLGDGILEYLDYLKNNQCDIVGIPTGFPRFDQGIGGGLRRKTVNIVAARSGVGKSLFGMNVGINISNTGVPVIFLDTEMDKETSTNRILAAISGVDIKDIETGKFHKDEEKVKKVLKASEQLINSNFYYINISGKPFASICNIIKRWAMQHVGFDEHGNRNDCVIIYDYLKLMDSSGISSSMQEYQVLGFQITELHNLMVKLDTPCLTFVQLNRDGISKEDSSAVSGSDRLLWLCTSLAYFKEKSEEEIAEDGVKNGNRKLIIIKARNGGGLAPGDYINVNMIGSCSKLIELKTRNESRFIPEEDPGFISKESVEEIDSVYLGQNHETC
jgi:replicative DNA helicase